MKVLFQGDSITDGGRLKTNTWDLNHQMGHGYASIINSYLGAKYPEKKLEFLNRGISGNRIADLYGRWKEDTLLHNPDVISILIGVNDAYSIVNNESGSEYERFKKIYRLLIEEAKELLSEAEALGDIEAFNNIDRMIIETIVLFEEIYKEDLYKR